jgi:quinol monooxygenase YgiN
MILVITDNKVKNREAYLSLAKAFVEDTLNDKGCREMQLCIDAEQTERVVFVSKWEEKEDFMAHVQGETFAKHIVGMSPYYVTGTDTFLEIKE